MLTRKDQPQIVDTLAPSILDDEFGLVQLGEIKPEVIFRMN